MVVMGLIEVELGDIKKVKKEFADLLKQRLNTDVTMKGGKLLLDQTDGHVNPKDVKLQVEHALRHLGFTEGYRVLSEHHIIRIEKLAEKKKPKVEEGQEDWAWHGSCFAGASQISNLLTRTHWETIEHDYWQYRSHRRYLKNPRQHMLEIELAATGTKR